MEDTFPKKRLAGVALILAATVLTTSVAHTSQAPKVSPQQVKAISAWSGSLVVQAATYAAPIVAMYLLRNSTSFGAHPKAPPNEIWRADATVMVEFNARRNRSRLTAAATSSKGAHSFQRG